MDTMPGIFDRQRAVFDFRKFVAGHRASQGRCVNFAAAYLPFIAPAKINRGEALNVFLKLHPEHADHRSAVSKDFDEQELFSFSKERWGETTKKLSPEKPK
jgi:hypothetical protein